MAKQSAAVGEREAPSMAFVGSVSVEGRRLAGLVGGRCWWPIGGREGEVASEGGGIAGEKTGPSPVKKKGVPHFDPSWYPPWPTWGAYELTPSQYEKRKERERRRPSRMNRRRRLGRRAPNRRALTQAALRLMPIQARKRRVRAWWRGQKRREMDRHT